MSTQTKTIAQLVWMGEIKLSQRTVNALVQNKLYQIPIADIALNTRRDMLSMDLIGPVVVDEIATVLSANGLSFREPTI